MKLEIQILFFFFVKASASRVLHEQGIENGIRDRENRFYAPMHCRVKSSLLKSTQFQRKPPVSYFPLFVPSVSYPMIHFKRVSILS
jgi:hypothetical protein